MQKSVAALRTVFVPLLMILAATALNAQTTIGSVALTAGWATFGQALPQGAATAALKVGTLTTQTDVKNRWPDGSIKFALVTVNVPSAGSYAITAAAAPTGTFAALLPTASVTLRIGGIDYVAALPASKSGDAWMSGPLAYERHQGVAGQKTLGVM